MTARWGASLALLIVGGLCPQADAQYASYYSAAPRQPDPQVESGYAPGEYRLGISAMAPAPSGPMPASYDAPYSAAPVGAACDAGCCDGGVYPGAWDEVGPPCGCDSGPACNSCQGGLGLGCLLHHCSGAWGDGAWGPRWWTVHATYVNLHRRESSSDEFDLSSGGVNGSIVLRTDSAAIDSDEDLPGARISLRADLWNMSFLEATYLGKFRQSAFAQVTSVGATGVNNNLFHVFSDFGDPASPFFPGFDETDSAQLHSVANRSEIDGVEINFRRYWTSPAGHFHSTWLMGARYFQLRELLRHQTVSPGGLNPGAMDYRVGADNDLVGFQLGGDLYFGILPRLMVGAEAKAGVYQNFADQNTRIIATTLPGDLLESASRNSAAYLGEATVTAVCQLTPSWSLRADYSLMFVDRVALSGANFNTTTPFVNPLVRANTVGINTSGDVTYHMMMVGLEWLR